MAFTRLFQCSDLDLLKIFLPFLCSESWCTMYVHVNSLSWNSCRYIWPFIVVPGSKKYKPAVSSSSGLIGSHGLYRMSFLISLPWKPSYIIPSLSLMIIPNTFVTTIRGYIPEFSGCKYCPNILDLVLSSIFLAIIKIIGFYSYSFADYYIHTFKLGFCTLWWWNTRG